LLLSACHQPTQKSKEAEKTMENDLHVLDSQEFQANFSDLKKQDKFQLKVIGHNYLDSKILFEIFNPKGERIYIDSFYGQDLLYDGADLIPSEAAKEDSVQMHFYDFFDASNFSQPASSVFTHLVYYENNMDSISDSSSYYQQVIERFELDKNPEWLDISHDSSAVGFQYAYGYEGVYNIAYSKKQKKVVQYFVSD